MNKNKFTGWQKVFVFSLSQLLKAKSQIICMVIFCGIALLSMPIMGMFHSEEETGRDLGIDKVTIIDETPLHLKDWLDIKAMEPSFQCPKTIVFSDQPEEELVDKLKDEKSEAELLLTIRYEQEENSFQVIGCYGKNSPLAEVSVGEFTDFVAENFQKQMISHMNITDEQIAYLNRPVETETEILTLSEMEGEKPGEDAEEEEEKDALTMTEYSVTLGIICVMIMMISISGEQVSSGVVMEKSSKIIDSLLISVKPMALLFGKILAAFVLCMIQIIGLIVCVFISNGIYLIMNPGSRTTFAELVKQISGGDTGLVLHLSALPAVILFIMAGVLLYGTIASLIGASVSRAEDLAESMKGYSLIMVVGAYLCIAVVAAELTGNAPDALVLTAKFLPVSSVFLVPAYLLIGRISLVETLIAALILIVTLYLVLRLASNVYEMLIYYKGKVLKLSEIIKMDRGIVKNRKNGKNGSNGNNGYNRNNGNDQGKEA